MAPANVRGKPGATNLFLCNRSYWEKVVRRMEFSQNKVTELSSAPKLGNRRAAEFRFLTEGTERDPFSLARSCFWGRYTKVGSLFISL